MTYVVFALWILMWGTAGYFTVKVIQMHIEKKRIEKAMAARAKPYGIPGKKSTDASTDNQVVYNPFIGIL